MQRMPFKYSKTEDFIEVLSLTLSGDDMSGFNFRHYPSHNNILIYDNLECKGFPLASISETDKGILLNSLSVIDSRFTAKEVKLVESLFEHFTYSELE